MKQLDTFVDLLNCFFITLRGHFSLVFNCDTSLTNPLHLFCSQRALLVGNHCSFNSFLLLHRLLFQSKEFIFGILLINHGMLVNIP